MDRTTTDRASPARAWWGGSPLARRTAVVFVAVLLSACGLLAQPLPELSSRSTDVYAVDLPADWAVVDDADATYQVAEEGVDRPMTVRVVLTEEPVDDVGVMAEAVRAGAPSLSDDARVVGERERDVPGATGAVELTTVAELSEVASGDELTVRIVDLLARAPDGRVVDVKVMGPDDSFDGDLAEAVLASLTLEPAGDDG